MGYVSKTSTEIISADFAWRFFWFLLEIYFRVLQLSVELNDGKKGKTESLRSQLYLTKDDALLQRGFLGFH